MHTVHCIKINLYNQLYIHKIRSSDISLEDLAATEFNDNFSGREPRQDVKVFRRFRNSVPIFKVCEYGDGVSTRNVGKPSHPDAAVCPRNFH